MQLRDRQGRYISRGTVRRVARCATNRFRGTSWSGTPIALGVDSEEEGTWMVTRRCIHCEADIEMIDSSGTTCPICGLDPDLPKLAFDDAPAFFFAGEPRLEPIPIVVRSRIPA
jgi:hypothetical protein